MVITHAPLRDDIDRYYSQTHDSGIVKIVEHTIRNVQLMVKEAATRRLNL